MTPELVLDCRATIGESLLWVAEEGRLYFVDIKAPCLYALRLETGERRAWALPDEVGGFALDGAGRALVALRSGLHWLSLESGALSLIGAPPFDPALIRFNESACDSRGRFWVGCMSDPVQGGETAQTGALYSFTSAEGLRAYPDFPQVTNGMAWNEDESCFFIAHSKERRIYKFSYDGETGRLGPRRIFTTIHGDEGVPDGAAVDADGGYWCAVHGAGCLHRYGRDGDFLQSVPLPVSQPTMCCFAGPGLRDLYVSSARDGLDEAALCREPLAGGLFRLRPEYPGLTRHWRVA